MTHPSPRHHPAYGQTPCISVHLWTDTSAVNRGHQPDHGRRHEWLGSSRWELLPLGRRVITFVVIRGSDFSKDDDVAPGLATGRSRRAQRDRRAHLQRAPAYGRVPPARGTAGHSLSATDLISEVYLRLAGGAPSMSTIVDTFLPSRREPCVRSSSTTRAGGRPTSAGPMNGPKSSTRPRSRLPDRGS